MSDDDCHLLFKEVATKVQLIKVFTFDVIIRVQGKATYTYTYNILCKIKICVVPL